MQITRIAIVGAGDISAIYLKNIRTVFRSLEVAGIFDLNEERARAAVETYEIPRQYHSMDELLADDSVSLVLNITPPYAHYEVSKALLLGGKHVYSEKPLAATLAEGRELVQLAQEKGLFLGGAPDTFLGAGIQTCRRLIDDGFIGEPLGAAAFMICHGHEHWHPSPSFYYKAGGGPMLDMGPYYLTALINLMGGVRQVAGMSRASFPVRTITSKPQYGTPIEVEVPTHTAGLLQFENGAIGTIFTTFDVYYKEGARLEIYGTKGTLIVPDPNTFGGPIRLLRPEEGAYKEMPLLFPYAENSRGIGLADAAQAIASGRPARAGWQQTLHVLEIMEGFQTSSQTGRFVPIESTFTRQAPMPDGLLPGVLD